MKEVRLRQEAENLKYAISALAIEYPYSKDDIVTFQKELNLNSQQLLMVVGIASKHKSSLSSITEAIKGKN